MLRSLVRGLPGALVFAIAFACQPATAESNTFRCPPDNDTSDRVVVYRHVGAGSAEDITAFENFTNRVRESIGNKATTRLERSICFSPDKPVISGSIQDQIDELTNSDSRGLMSLRGVLQLAGDVPQDTGKVFLPDFSVPGQAPDEMELMVPLLANDYNVGKNIYHVAIYYNMAKDLASHQDPDTEKILYFIGKAAERFCIAAHYKGAIELREKVCRLAAAEVEVVGVEQCLNLCGE